MSLTTRQHQLKNYLETHFESGKFFSIEEICNAGLGYVYNTNPYTHDHCVALGNDVKALNWATDVERYTPIIKDAKGGIKLCESEEELNEFVEKQKRKVEKAYQYANHLKSLKFIDGQVRFINLNNRVLDEDEMKPIDVYKKDTTELADQSN